MTTQTQAIAARIQKAEMRRPARIALLVLNYVGPLIVLILLWQWGTTTFPNKFFPPPFTIVENAQKLFFGGDASTLFMTPALTVDTAATLYRLLVGFAVGSAFGILVGMAIVMKKYTPDGKPLQIRGTNGLIAKEVVEVLGKVPSRMVLSPTGQSQDVPLVKAGTSYGNLLKTFRERNKLMHQAKKKPLS